MTEQHYCQSCRRTHEDRPHRPHRKHADVMEDYAFVKETQGGTVEQIASRLGMSAHALRQHLLRDNIRERRPRGEN